MFVVCGEALMDVYVRDSTATGLLLDARVGGSPFNVAIGLARMGQPPFNPRSPAGFADDAAEWSGPDALWKRVQAAQSLADAAPATRTDALAAAGAVFADQIDKETLVAIRRAESARDALAVLMASPAFQWRT